MNIPRVVLMARMTEQRPFVVRMTHWSAFYEAAGVTPDSNNDIPFNKNAILSTSK